MNLLDYIKSKGYALPEECTDGYSHAAAYNQSRTDMLEALSQIPYESADKGLVDENK